MKEWMYNIVFILLGLVVGIFVLSVLFIIFLISTFKNIVYIMFIKKT